MHPPVRALRPTLWPLVAAAALLLLMLIPSAGHAATACQRIMATATAADLDPSASWHGRSVRRVVRSAAPAARRTGATAFFDLRPGAGYATGRGSAAVRMLQRRLRKLGYSPGPADGRYGSRTRDAVGWFQLKHGLRVDGLARAATQRRLQAPAAARTPRTPRTPNPASAQGSDGVAACVVRTGWALGGVAAAGVTCSAVDGSGRRAVAAAGPPLMRAPARDCGAGAAAGRPRAR